MPTLSNGTVVPPDDGDVQISATGVAEMRALGASVDAQLGDRSRVGHTHDDRYYTESEMDGKLGGKVDTTDSRLSDARPPTAHTHRISDVDGLAAFTQDTGWLDVSADLLYGATGVLHVRRAGMHMHWRVRDLIPGTAHAFYWPPSGMVAPQAQQAFMPQATSNPSPFYLDSSGRLCRLITAPALTAGRWWEGLYLLPPGTAPIASPPGTVVPA